MLAPTTQGGKRGMSVEEEEEKKKSVKVKGLESSKRHLAPEDLGVEQELKPPGPAVVVG